MARHPNVICLARKPIFNNFSPNIKPQASEKNDGTDIVHSLSDVNADKDYVLTLLVARSNNTQPKQITILDEDTAQQYTFDDDFEFKQYLQRIRIGGLSDGSSRVLFKHIFVLCDFQAAIFLYHTIDHLVFL